MAIVRRSLVVALALITAVCGAEDDPRPAAAPAAPPRLRGTGLVSRKWQTTTCMCGVCPGSAACDGSTDWIEDLVILDPDPVYPNEDEPDFTAAEARDKPASKTEEPRKEKDLSWAAPAPRPAPRPCTTTKPVLKPNPYEDASEPGDTIAARPQDPDEEKASKKRPGEPDIDIVIDSDGS